MNLRLAIPLAVVLLAVYHGHLSHDQRPAVFPSESGLHVSADGEGHAPSVVAADAEITMLPSEDPWESLTKGLYQGLPIEIGVGSQPARSYIFRPRQATTDSFAFSLGLSGDSLDLTPLVFDGFAVRPEFAMDLASLVIVGDRLSAVIREANGSTLYVRQDPATGALQARRETFASYDTYCQIDPVTGVSTMRSDDPIGSDAEDWDQADVASIKVAALTGIDPASGDLDKYVNLIPRATAYDASLKDALMLLVLDKETTGSGSIQNLKSKASLYLATVSNVAAVYENQLGIRLLLSEMIMIPNESSYEDIPNGDVIDDFRDWVTVNRSNSTYQWSLAAKVGDGLEGTTLGVAFVNSIRSNSAVSVSRPTAIWDVIAHEVGHNLGSDHSEGGIMNASTTNGSTRSFFTDVSVGETSAKDIYDYARSRLLGPAVMRHPEEMPFAQRDYRMTPVNQAVRLSPLDNDNDRVRNGAVNALALEEVSSVMPLSAGSVTVSGEEVVFTPSEGFEGTAWFSYTIRGSVGNDGAGWLHKGDVAIDVGQFEEPTTFELAPGASYSFIPLSTSGLTQPQQALVSQSRDDRDLLIIRVDPDATGSDTFRAGGQTFTLNYTSDSPVVTNDLYVYDPASGPLRFNPLLNDEGAGEFWVNPVKPSIGVGTFGHDSNGEELFSTTFRLASARNLTPEKGSLSTSVRAFIVNGRRDNRLDSTLTFTPASGASGVATIEYTVEDATGTQATGLAEIVLPFRVDRLVTTGDAVRYRVPDSSATDETWMLPGFDDSSWTSAVTGIGYDDNADFLPEIASTISGLGNVNTSVFMRLPFNVESADQYDQISLRLKIDDGFVAYLNGMEVARSSNAPIGRPLPWDAQAVGSNLDSQALQFVTFDISSMRGVLNDGENVLAIHGLNASLASSDFLMVPEMDAVVTSSSATIVSPVAEAIGLPLGTGLLLQGRTSGAVAGGNVSWSVVSGPEGGTVFESANSLSTVVTFAMPGEYRLRLTAVAGTQTSSAEVQVSVPISDGLPQGAEVNLGEDRSVTGYVATLSGEVSPDVVDHVTWRQISGSDVAVFSSTNTLKTDVGFASGGDYGLRLVVENDGIQTFQDIVLTVAGESNASLAVLVQPTLEVSSSSAILSGAAFFAGDAAIATFYLGLMDGGENAGGWEREVPLGTQASGNIETRVNDLLFGSTYVYRLRLERAGVVVWSDVASFATLPAPRVNETLVAEGAAATIFVPKDALIDTVWFERSFDDEAWISGSASVGYDLDDDFSTWIDTDIEAEMFEQSSSVYLRIPFNVTAKESVESLMLHMRYDDAFIAYLNGHEIARSATAPQDGALGWDTRAAILRDDPAAVVFEEFDVSHHTDLIAEGTNVLSVHGLNFIVENRDMLISPQLEATRSLSHYEHWLLAFPGLAADDWGLLGNPDGDAFDNLQEYAFGGDPTRADSVAALTPTVRLGESNSIELSFRRRYGIDSRGVTVNLESSSDLQNWAVVDLIGATSSRASDGIERVTLPLSVTAFETFWRLNISVNE